MKKAIILMTIFIFSTITYASNSINGVEIKKIVPTENGIILSLSHKPTFCSGFLNDFHAVIKSSHSSFNNIRNQAYFSKMLVKPVEVIYESQGSCSNESTALNVIDIKEAS